MMTDDEHQNEEAENEDGEVSDDALDEVFDDELDEEAGAVEADDDERAAFGDDGLDE